MTRAFMGLWGYMYWPLYLTAVSAGFLPAEIVAIATNTRNTLSYYAWHELGVMPGGKPLPDTAAWFLTQAAFIVMVIWLWRHIWYHQYA